MSASTRQNLLDPRCVHGLHGLVDFEEGTATWEVDFKSIEMHSFARAACVMQTSNFARCSPPLDSKLGIPCMMTW